MAFKRTYLILLVVLGLSLSAKAQNDSIFKKTGWTFGALPAVAFESDIGFKYGGVVNLFYYGNGSTYPQYLHSLLVEVSRTTKGSGINQLFYDSEHLIPIEGLRVTADVSYLTEQALDFYGFNGHQAVYNSFWEDDESDDYISRVFYRQERRQLRMFLHFQYKLTRNWRVFFGLAHHEHNMRPVDIDKLNKGQKEEDMLPDTTTLFELYTRWQVLPEKEIDGGKNNLLKLGIIYDTRDNQASPKQGIWTEALLFTAPSMLGNKENQFTRIAAIHRQYIPVSPSITFAYRVGAQGTLSGKPPYYMLPYLMNSFSPSTLNEGLGGAKSLRGVLRNRVVADAIGYTNLEMRWRFYNFNLFQQQFTLTLSSFYDAGLPLKEVELNLENIPDDVAKRNYFSNNNNDLHQSMGIGLHAAMNENFVIAIDYGHALDKRDGNSGLYIGMNFLF
jgi:outer membrane protein assembly factor BamA